MPSDYEIENNPEEGTVCKGNTIDMETSEVQMDETIAYPLQEEYSQDRVGSPNSSDIQKNTYDKVALKEKWLLNKAQNASLLKVKPKKPKDENYTSYKCRSCSQVMDSLDAFSRHCLGDCVAEHNPIIYCPADNCSYNIDKRRKDIQKSVDDLCAHIR